MPLMCMLLPAAFVNSWSFGIVLLSSACVLTYCGASLHNSIQDRDHLLPGYAKALAFALPVVALVVSYQNKVVFFTVLAWIALGLLYNTVSRKIVLGDISVLGITHLAIPVISSGIILGMELAQLLKIAVYLYAIFLFLGSMKNIKDTESDKARGYKTFSTVLPKGEHLTKVLAGSASLLMLASYFVLGLSYRFLVLFAVIVTLKLYSFTIKDKGTGFSLFKYSFVLFLLSIILDKTQVPAIILTGTAYSFIYLMPYIITLVKQQRVVVANG